MSSDISTCVRSFRKSDEPEKENSTKGTTVLNCLGKREKERGKGRLEQWYIFYIFIFFLKLILGMKMKKKKKNYLPILFMYHSLLPLQIIHILHFLTPFLHSYYSNTDRKVLYHCIIIPFFYHGVI